MKTVVFTTVDLDQPRPLRWGFDADHRLASLNGGKHWVSQEWLRSADYAQMSAAVCAWTWACLFEEHPFKTPSDLAAFLTTKGHEGLLRVAKSLAHAYTLAHPEVTDEKKESTESSPSPDKSSG